MICFPTSGTYPIAISADYLDASGFINPDGYYSDGTYQNKTWKRLYMRTNANPSGGFYFLRWKADPTTANQMELTSALTGTGNLSQGFEEAPWPEINPLNLPKPAGYPLAMYQLNPGDWTYVNSSVEGSNNAALRPALDYHVANQTLMILPLSDMVVGTGIHSIYHVSRPGAFLLLSYSTDSLPYLDLVYIEEPPTVSCSG